MVDLLINVKHFDSFFFTVFLWFETSENKIHSIYLYDLYSIMLNKTDAHTQKQKQQKHFSQKKNPFPWKLSCYMKLNSFHNTYFFLHVEKLIN